MNNKQPVKSTPIILVDPNAARLIEFPTNHEGLRGSLTVIDDLSKCVPFTPKRMMWIYDVALSRTRGGILHKDHQLIIAIMGKFTVWVNEKAFHLYDCDYGLYVPPMNIIKAGAFLEGSAMLVLSSDLYDPCEGVKAKRSAL